MVVANVSSNMSNFGENICNSNEYSQNVNSKIKEVKGYLKTLLRQKNERVNVIGKNFIERERIIQTLDMLENTDVNNFLDLKFIAFEVPECLKSVQCVQELCSLSDVAVRVMAS